MKSIATKSLMPELSFIVSGGGNVSGVVLGARFSANPDHPNYNAIRDAIRAKDAVEVKRLVNVAKAVATISKGFCEVRDGQVLYNGAPIGNSVAGRIVQLMRTGWDFDPMLRFLENLMMNPSATAREELYLFLECANLPITEDGCFLAYKKCDENYRSIHVSPDGSHADHSIGKVLEMARDKVDADRDRTCSFGYHFASRTYLPHYGSCPNNKIVIVKINPRDVCAIPSDFNNAKGRTCKYEVVGEHKDGQDVEAFDAAVPVYSVVNGVPVANTAKTPTGGSYVVKRDANGRFQ